MSPRPSFLPTPVTSRPRPTQTAQCCQKPPTAPHPPSNSRTARYETARRYSLSIAQHAKSGNFTALQQVVQSAKSAGVKLNTINYTAIAHAYVSHDPAKVFTVFSQMRDINLPPTNVTLRVAIKAAIAWREARPAVHALRAVLAWVAGEGKDKPDVKSWNMALSALAKKEAYFDVAKVFSWMCCGEVPGVENRGKAGGVPCPNTISYNTALHTLGKQGQFQEALALFGKMLVAKHCAGDESAPDVVTYNTLLGMAVNERHVAVLSGMEGSEGRPNCRPAPFVDAILASMKRQKVQPNITTETLMLRLLTRKHAMPPEPSRVWESFRCVLGKREWFQPDKRYFDALLTAFAHARDMNGIAHVFKEMISGGMLPDIYTIRALLVAASHCGDVQLATSILQITHDNGLHNDKYSYTSAISACARASPKDAQTADLLLTEALERGTTWTPAMINATISSYGDDISKALALWKRLRSCRDEDSRAVLTERVVYDALMRVCGRCSRPDVALRILYAAKNASHITTNSPESRVIFNAFSRGLEEANAVENMSRNPLKRQYLQHLKAECGVTDGMNLPIERIRIKF